MADITAGPCAKSAAQSGRIDQIDPADCMKRRIALALLLMLPPSLAFAADITGVPKIREGDSIVIGATRIRLGGIDAPSTDQLCLNTKGERWTCGVAARDELIKHTEGKGWTCHLGQTDRRGRALARCEG